MGPIKDISRSYRDYNDDYVHHKLTLIIKDLRRKLNDPRFSNAQKKEMANKIAELEHFGKSDLKKANFQILLLDVTRMVSSYFGGAVGSGVFSFIITNKERSLRTQREFKIAPSKKIAGRRQVQRKTRSNVSAIHRSSMPDVSSIQKAALVTITGLVMGFITFQAKDFGMRTFSYVRSFFPL